jgi:hypothetical protein
MVYLPWQNSCGNTTLGNKILVWQYRLLQRRCSWQIASIVALSIVACTTSCYEDECGKCFYCHDHERCINVLLPYLATDTYRCKKPLHLRRQSSNGCNNLLQRDFLQPLAMNAIWLQHLPFATKLGLLQHFFVVVQRLQVSSGIYTCYLITYHHQCLCRAFAASLLIFIYLAIDMCYP